LKHIRQQRQQRDFRTRLLILSLTHGLIADT
jgi:hypothetical protein